MALTGVKPKPKLPDNHLRRATVAVCALVFVALLDSAFVAAIAPQIADDFNVDKTLVVGSATIYALAAASVGVLLGISADRFRPLVWLPLASLLFVAAALIAAVAAALPVFYLARALSGFAGGLISALAITALADASSYARRGRRMSLVAVVYFLAPVVGIPVSAEITQKFNWRMSFILVAVLSAIAGMLVWRFPLAVISAASETRESHSASGDNRLSISSVILATLPKWFDSRSKVMGVIGAFFVSGGVVGFISFVGVWLSEAFNRQPNEIAVVYASAGGAAVGGGALGGFLADRYGKRRVALGSSLGLMALLIIVPTFAWSITLIALTAAAAFVAALRIAPLQALISELVDSKVRGAYIAWRNASSQLGIAAAVALSAPVYTRFSLFGVGVVCAVLTLFAWLCIRLIKEPSQISAIPPTTAELSSTSNPLARRESENSNEDEHASNSVVGLGSGTNGLPTRKIKFGARRVLQLALTLIVAVAVAVPFMLSLAITKAVTRSDERNRPETPATYNVKFENAVFMSADGNRLSGWYLPNDEKNLTIVMTHGLFRSRYELLERAVDFWRRGYAVLLYDVRRHGDSTGEFSTIGYKERLDVIAALDFAETRAPTHHIALLGVSMGAAATLLAASEAGDRVTAIIAESSFLSFKDTVTHHIELAGIPTFPLAALLINLTAWRMNFDPDEFDVKRAVGRITVPILFIGGGRDQRMPTATVLEPLYAAARSPLKQKFIIPEAKHGQAYAAAPAQYVQTVDDFLARATAAN